MELRIDSFEQLHEAVQSFGNSVMIYRGVSSSAYKLVPKIGRYVHRRKNTRLDNEIKILNIFKERTSNSLGFKPENDFEWLAIAQHHGLSTRLLDWTRNPLVAAYFAVEEDHQHEDSVIYAYANPKIVDIRVLASPFAVSDVILYYPVHVTPRITAQSGLFTVHPYPELPFESDSITCLYIGESYKTKLRTILYKYGIHRASLFPDLDGIAQFIDWLCTKKEST
jgi:hypothetical protein